MRRWTRGPGQIGTSHRRWQRETEFLEELARVETLREERPVLDGQALVIQLTSEELTCEFVIEARLPRSKEEAGVRLLVYLQNVSDEPLRVGLPEFILTGGVRLPWHVGLRSMINPSRGELVEVVAWDLQTGGAESCELLASEITAILDTCRKVVAR